MNIKRCCWTLYTFLCILQCGSIAVLTTSVTLILIPMILGTSSCFNLQRVLVFLKCDILLCLLLAFLPKQSPPETRSNVRLIYWAAAIWVHFLRTILLIWFATTPIGILFSLCWRGSSEKAKNASSWSSPLHILKPEWLFDCFKEWKYLPEEEYRLTFSSTSSGHSLSTSLTKDSAPKRSQSPFSQRILLCCVWNPV